MKKLLLSIVFVLFSIVLFAQPSFMRGHTLYIGTVANSGKVDWDEGSESNVLIEVDGSHIVIYSATQQDLHCIKLISSDENQSKWRAVDQDGSICFLYVGYDKIADSTYLMVEYSDVWYCFYTSSEK
jgi:hypothetical protein